MNGSCVCFGNSFISIIIYNMYIDASSMLMVVLCVCVNPVWDPSVPQMVRLAWIPSVTMHATTS